MDAGYNYTPYGVMAVEYNKCTPYSHKNGCSIQQLYAVLSHNNGCRIQVYVVWSHSPCEVMAVGYNKCTPYWAIQAGLLTPLNFSRHRLSRLAAFTSGAYFLHNGRR